MVTDPILVKTVSNLIVSAVILRFADGLVIKDSFLHEVIIEKTAIVHKLRIINVLIIFQMYFFVLDFWLFGLCIGNSQGDYT